MQRKFWRTLWTVSAGLLLMTAAVRAQETPSQPKPEEKKSEEKKPAEENGGRRNRNNGNWLGGIGGRFRATDKHERDHESIRVAFKEVVNEPHKATVRILSDEKASALGIVVDADGYILTKASEVRGKVGVKMFDNRLFEAQIVGIDHKSDLAMLKIPATGLAAISWRDGQDVPAVGSWLASASLETLPVAIGVVSVQPRLIQSPRAVLGIVLEEVDTAAKIKTVRPNGGAAKAGMKEGDLILAINGQPIAGREALINTVKNYKPGDRIALEIKRGEETINKDVMLSTEQQISPDSERKDFQNTLGGPLSERRAGFDLALQHDTVLSPQDCGGPLVDLDGRCVGINIARAGRVNSYALPASLVVPLVAEFKAGKFAPGGDPAEKAKLELVKRRDQLKQSETTLATKLAQMVETIKKLQTDAAAEELKKAEAERMATETELGKIKEELQKLDSQKTSVEK